MQEQKQTHHGGTGDQETDLGSTKTNSGAEKEAEVVDDRDATVRNPAGDNIADAVDGDEGSGRSA